MSNLKMGLTPKIMSDIPCLKGSLRVQVAEFVVASHVRYFALDADCDLYWVVIAPQGVPAEIEGTSARAFQVNLMFQCQAHFGPPFVLMQPYIQPFGVIRRKCKSRFERLDPTTPCSYERHKCHCPFNPQVLCVCVLALSPTCLMHS